MAQPIIVAHRGASADAPENTLAAFRLAWSQGADAIEGDFRLSADGQVVCIHDADTKRVAGVERLVARSDAALLREAADVPSLREVLETVPDGKGLYLELKDGPEIVPPVFETLRDFADAQLEVFIISFDPAVVQAVKVTDPSLKAGLLIDFDRRGLRLTPGPAEIVERAGQCGADAVSVKAHPMMPESLGRQVREAGYGFHVWTVDSPAWAQEMARRGAQSITTNQPALIRRTFAASDTASD